MELRTIRYRLRLLSIFWVAGRKREAIRRERERHGGRVLGVDGWRGVVVVVVVQDEFFNFTRAGDINRDKEIHNKRHK